MKGIKWFDEKKENPLETNRLLLESTLDEFSKCSYNEASLNEIIKRADMRKGSFYYRFYDKKDLYLSLFYYIGMRKAEMINSNATTSQKDDFFASLREKTILALKFARMEKRYYDFWRIYIKESEEVKNFVHECFGGYYTDEIYTWVEEAKKTGKIRSDVNSKLLADFINILIERIDLLISPEQTDEQIYENVCTMMNLIEHGIKKTG